MPKNKGKGGKNRKKGTNKNETQKRELVLREDGQEYGICTAMVGCNRIRVHLFSGLDVIGVIRGKIVRRLWINLGNVVLCGNREFQSGSPKVDIILRYTPEEAGELQRLGQIPDISRWSVVGRGGMVEESEDASGGNIKFTSDSGPKQAKPKANDGWEMPSSDEFEEGEEGEDDDDDSSDEEGEESSEGEPEIDVGTYRKEDRHSGKVSRKQEDFKKKNVRDNVRKGNAAPEKPSGRGQPNAPVQPSQQALQQRAVQPLGDDDLNIDEI